jgi:hypothetical protein
MGCPSNQLIALLLGGKMFILIVALIQGIKFIANSTPATN